MPSMFSGIDASRLTVMAMLGMLGAAWKPIHLVWHCAGARFGLRTAHSPASLGGRFVGPSL
ncbi:hypothetical protein [Pseudomonas syringae]|uniref:Uncharacterized protein n=1 Tax=Pseudomonas syringae pv. papulans TaxID=83963 RepID=A0A3M6DBA0_PSESX|nr:hypothetical protein [Pseudomonas syringae]MDH4603231.1 hypothetical protein [Pseudomonas syringae pv. papulans]MDH4624239.1 hypothetical protein [Pseudomonas syringae pv. papulans]RMN41848.1 hypothetical protein ALQ60_100848 [Pseudomonas syringae pv. papulans]RMN83893.1 hypothetical protein ALQ56_101197 [Pseudomonas syringae pv. papulans]RMV53448.1 hypothetical protein ALP11_101037 [Pseudomonas syringae pv. papulans]